MMTDPLADMLTRIRNAVLNKDANVRIPGSKLKVNVADVLKREGYIDDCKVIAPKPEEGGKGQQGWLELRLRYGPDGEHVISYLQRVSKPGRRVYSGAKDLKPVLNGLGIDILSTSKGVLSDREARSKKVGGEVLARVY